MSSDLNTTIPNIQMIDIPKEAFEVIQGKADIDMIENKFISKKFLFSSGQDFVIRLNTFNFPGWKVYIDGEEKIINDDNDFKLITVNVPKGDGILEFSFENTPVRNIGNLLSLISLVFVGFLILSFKLKKMKS
jgi:hypothetical protein